MVRTAGVSSHPVIYNAPAAIDPSAMVIFVRDAAPMRPTLRPILGYENMMMTEAPAGDRVAKSDDALAGQAGIVGEILRKYAGRTRGADCLHKKGDDCSGRLSGDRGAIDPVGRE